MRVLAAMLLFSAIAPSVFGAARSGAVDVLHYIVELSPDIERGHIAGRVTIHLRGLSPLTSELGFDAGALEVTAVVGGDLRLRYSKSGSLLRVSLAEPLVAGHEQALTITYRGNPQYGLEVHPDRSEIYTVFSTSQWMICVDAPSERATLDLTVRLPKEMKAAGSGRKLVSPDPIIHRWHLDVPMPSYVYGFAAGRYEEYSETIDGMVLRYLSADRSPDELHRIFRESAGMLQFFGEQAGLPYRGEYTQALVKSTIGQELAGLSLISETAGLRMLVDPSDIALMAHEAAHQWWGNLLTCQDWRHFWLNEGFATFMAAAYLERRFGRDDYLRQVDGWRHRLKELQADGKDRPLVYPDWNTPTADDRAVVYQKGALFLHLLREHLGDARFWRGIRRYTRGHAGQSVISDDLKAAMEAVSREDLTALFEKWVY
jgi:aminopeptidase N